MVCHRRSRHLAERLMCCDCDHGQQIDPPVVALALLASLGYGCGCDHDHDHQTRMTKRMRMSMSDHRGDRVHDRYHDDQRMRMKRMVDNHAKTMSREAHLSAQF